MLHRKEEGLIDIRRITENVVLFVSLLQNIFFVIQQTVKSRINDSAVKEFF